MVFKFGCFSRRYHNRGKKSQSGKNLAKISINQRHLSIFKFCKLLQKVDQEI